MVNSVPGELSMDHTAVLQQANSENAFVSKSILEKELKWEAHRAQKALDYTVKEGLAWIDKQGPSENLYWFPSLFSECVTSRS